jgi:hypothetical protein
VVRDTLDSAFPITLAALGEETWDSLVQDFFAKGMPSAPQIWRLPFSFYQYHAGLETGSILSRPYLEDLLYFEWIEIEVYNMPDREYPAYKQKGNLLIDRLAFNPEYEIVRLEYPVHMHSVDEAAGQKGDYYALVFRVPESGHVQFLNMSPMNIYILTRLVEEDIPVNQLKGEIARASGIESMKYLDDVLSAFISDLLEKKLILGFRIE